MKYFAIILLVLTMSCLSYSQDKDELALAIEVNVLTKLKQWKKAEKVIKQLSN